MELVSTFKFVNVNPRRPVTFPSRSPSPRTFRQHYHVPSWPRSNSKHSYLCTDDTNKSRDGSYLTGPGTRNTTLPPTALPPEPLQTRLFNKGVARASQRPAYRKTMVPQYRFFILSKMGVLMEVKSSWVWVICHRGINKKDNRCAF